MAQLKKENTNTKSKYYYNTMILTKHMSLISDVYVQLSSSM